MPNNGRITWDEAEKRKYEYGVSQGVLYPMGGNGTYDAGVAWNGLINITDSPEGAEVSEMYADGIYYAGIVGAEKYGISIESYTYPDEFAECDGTVSPIPGMAIGQQSRKTFGLSWRSEIGNADNDRLGYKIHVAYGLRASVSEKSHDTVNDSPEAGTFSWDASGTPVPVTGYKPTAKLEFDSTKLGAGKMKALEDILYGTESTTARLPKPDEILSALNQVGG